MATHAAADRQPRVIAAMRRRAARARVAAVVAALAAAWCAHASFALQAASERQPLGAVAPATGGGAGEALRLVGALVVVVGLAFAAQWWIRRSGLVAKVQGGAFEVIARHPVGRGQAVLVARFGARMLLVQQSREGLRTLCEIDDPAEVAELIAQSRGGSVPASAERTVDLRRGKDGAS
jgi:flagellar biogenesis protein FliO